MSEDITDLYKGELLETWMDEEFVYISLFHCSAIIYMPIEDFPTVVNELTRTAVALSEIINQKAS